MDAGSGSPARPPAIGPATAQLIETILRAKPHPEQGFRAALGILRLAKSYGAVRLEAACLRGLSIGASTYGSIASILKNGLDKAFHADVAPDDRTDPPRQHPRPRLLPLTTGGHPCSPIPPSSA